LGVQIISPDYSLLNKDNVLLMHKNGFDILPWTVNTVSDFKKMIEYGVDGIVTDYPKVMKDYIDAN
jgi:glycerophosphoryl diester phosphodiesterase